MISRTSRSFWKAYQNLPRSFQLRAVKQYHIWRNNPSHPSLHFKLVVPAGPIYSVRVTESYRALGILREGTILWFWIGVHDDYERVLKQYG